MTSNPKYLQIAKEIAQALRAPVLLAQQAKPLDELVLPIIEKHGSTRPQIRLMIKALRSFIRHNEFSGDEFKMVGELIKELTSQLPVANVGDTVLAADLVEGDVVRYGNINPDTSPYMQMTVMSVTSTRISLQRPYIVNGKLGAETVDYAPDSSHPFVLLRRDAR